MTDDLSILIGAATTAVLVGVVVGWFVRSARARREKRAINAGWQAQMEAQRKEHGRLIEQNKNLMEQVNQFQASGRDASNRAKELSTALKDAFERRDELQREIKEVRGNLESALKERRRSESRAESGRLQEQSADLAEKDAKIARLQRELDNWQERLPPLIERYRARDEEAQQLEKDLDDARLRITELEAELAALAAADEESGTGIDETRVEPISLDDLPEALTASNETINARVDFEGYDEGNGADSEPAEAAHNDSGGGLRDDLQRIKGVGPAIEKTLNELGIFRYSQVAAMSEYDIERVAKRLKGFRSRIYREDWIGQARSLQDQRQNP